MKIALLGDIGFFGKYSLERNKDIKNYFRAVSKHLNKYDLVIGNLETPFASGLNPKLIKSACLGSMDKNVELLKYLNVTVVNLANNHLYDYGKEGYDRTLSVLNANKIDYFGIENKAHIINDEGNKIAMHGYCAYNTSPSGMLTKNKSFGVNELNFPSVLNNFKDFHKKGFLNLLAMHSGLEHVNVPSYEDIKMARHFASIAPYIYYGHHPHVLQGIERVNNALIAYSLGNFCFDDVYTPLSKEPLVVQTENNKSSIILEVDIIDNKIVSYKTIPIYANENELEIGSEKIENNLKNYSQKLTIDKQIYKKEREALLKKFIDDRKQLRNINWYLKRLNYKSFVRIYDAKMNAKKHYNSVTKHFLD